MARFGWAALTLLEEPGSSGQSRARTELLFKRRKCTYRYPAAIPLLSLLSQLSRVSQELPKDGRTMVVGKVHVQQLQICRFAACWLTHHFTLLPSAMRSNRLHLRELDFVPAIEF